jgi:hypothetical protein
MGGKSIKLPTISYFLILMSVIIVCIVIYLLYTCNIEKFNSISYELIISRYNESLSWLDNKEYIDTYNKFSKIICYNKGNEIPNNSYIKSHPNQFQIKTLPNVGREAHTYLTHIIQNYDNLSDINVFVPGSCDVSNKWFRAINTMIKSLNTNNTVFMCDAYDSNLIEKIYNFKIDTYASTNSENLNLNNENNLKISPIRPFGKWYTHVFESTPLEYLSFNAIFAVSKEHIHNRSKDFYIKLLDYVNTSSNHEVAHYIERAWPAIFYPLPKECIYDTAVPYNNITSEKHYTQQKYDK